jgi:hypothetical protein
MYEQKHLQKYYDPHVIHNILLQKSINCLGNSGFHNNPNSTNAVSNGTEVGNIKLFSFR